jgi:ATP-dependent DNA helicase RecQ
MVTVSAPDVEAALSCVARFSDHLGAARIALILRGDLDAWATSKPWVAELPFFGALREWKLERVRDLISALVELGMVARGHSEKPTLSLTDNGRAVLAGNDTCRVELEPESAPGRATQGRLRPSSTALGASDLDAEALALLEALRKWRLETARRTEVPPYVVFHDKTLTEIALRRPTSNPELALVPGIGPAKLERYGPDLLAILGGE